MSTMQVTEKFDWLGELEKTVTHSLFTTFGLDPVLFQDKQGGNVDTVHNVRQGIWATETEKNIYDNQESYKQTKLDKDGNPVLNKNGKEKKEDRYHADSRFRQKSNKDKEKQLSGELFDEYRNVQAKVSENTQLDHVISSHEIHHDAGRVLAGINGIELSLLDDNLISTHAYINNKKSNMSMTEFVEKLPSMIETKQKSIQKNREKLATMPSETPEQRHKIRQIQSKIQKEEEHLQTLQSCDTEAMLNVDKKIRQEYDSKIANTYYTSSKFLMNAGTDAVLTGLKMGYRQTFGLVLAETWFELKFALPKILYKCRHDFSMDNFIEQVKETLDNIFENTKKRLQKAIANFKDSFLGGVLSSISTTIINIFFTTSKLIGRLIRESWQNLVQISKLMFFNLDRLSHGELMREITRLILASISTIIGVIVNQHLTTLFTFPFGVELANFLSALLTGILMVGCAYFIDYSPIMQKVWDFLDNLKDKYDIVLEHLQKANAELDQYLMELTKMEFNLDTEQLQTFADSLAITANEYQKSIVIKAEVERRNIELPFEMGNSQSTMAWLNGLKPKN